MKTRQIILNTVLIATFSFLGGMAGSFLLSAKEARAREAYAAQMNYFAIYDALNRKGIESYVQNGYPAQNFYARDGRVRIQHGIYNNPGEDGLPLSGMFDNTGQLRMLFRLAGPNESPVIIMKDGAGRDRIVMGLGLADKDQEPFLAVIDGKGRKKMIFGNY